MKKLLFLLSWCFSFSLHAVLPTPDFDSGVPNFCELSTQQEPEVMADADLQRLEDLKGRQANIWAHFRSLHHGATPFSSLEAAFKEEIVQFMLEAITFQNKFGFEAVTSRGLEAVAVGHILNYGGGVPTKDDLVKLEQEFFAAMEGLLDSRISAREAMKGLTRELVIKGSMLQQLPCLQNQIYPEDQFCPNYKRQQQLMGDVFNRRNFLALSEGNMDDFLKKSWSRESSSSKESWSAENPALGQDAATALIAQEVFGGDIVLSEFQDAEGRRVSHYKNLVAGRELDFTAQQFPEGTTIPAGLPSTTSFTSTREYLLSNADIHERYERLKKQLLNHLSD